MENLANGKLNKSIEQWTIVEEGKDDRVFILVVGDEEE